MLVEAKNFHPMRGHVEANMGVRFSNGAVLFVQPSGDGWALFNAFGDKASETTRDAYELTRWIVEKEEGKETTP